MMNWKCPKCKKNNRFPSANEIKDGHCATCEVNSWPAGKRDAMRAAIGAFAKGAPQAEINKKIDASLEYFK